MPLFLLLFPITVLYVHVPVYRFNKVYDNHDLDLNSWPHTHTQTTWVALIKKNEVCIKSIAQVNFFFVQLKSLHLMIILSPGIKENM